MKILVTGGAGFIGSNFIRLVLNKTKYHITNFDALSYAGNLENLKDIEENSRYKFVKGDVSNEKDAAKILKEIDLIFHFAAESHVDRSINDPYIFSKTNLIGTHVMLEAAKKNNVKKFIHISTDEVYGSIENGSFKEDSLLKPNSPYSASKAAADLMCRAYFTTYKFPVIIVRSTNNFGPRQYPEKLMPLFITNLLENKRVPLYGDGKNIRDWIYVSDNCEAILFASEHGKLGEIYNIGGGNELSNLEITKMILKELGKNESMIEYVKDRLGHDFRYSLNCEKLKKLGWKPKYPFDKALKETIQWYVQNTEWWKKLKG